MIQLIKENTSIKYENLAEQLAKLPKPDFRIEFLEIESWNTILAKSRSKNFRSPSPAESEIKKWRSKGFEKAIFYARRQGFEILDWTEYGISEKGKPTKTERSQIRTNIFSRCEVTLRFWRPDWTAYDVFSPIVKPIFDGFVDAGVIAKDDFQRVPKFTTEFMGVDSDLKLSDEATAIRKVKRQTVKGSLLKPSRFYFDFHNIPF